jgi:peptidoglycan/xylan/chitin deacetylase (PgdA/CDA1 family)
VNFKRLFAAGLAAGLGLAVAPAFAAPTGPLCRTDPLAPAVTPRVEIDATPDASGRPARFGAMQYPRTPLGPMRIALTIDDGPNGKNHDRVLDILDKHCLKASFFFVGYLSEARPDLVRETAARGHVIGTHSLTHPDNLRRLSAAGQAAQIDGGFLAAQRALQSAPPAQQAALAPFFRFPGLNDSAAMLQYLGRRRIAVFSAEFGTDDWKGISAEEIKRRGLNEAAQTHGGIVIVHESRPHTVEALDDLITQFERRGYSFVLLAPKPGDHDKAAAAPGAVLKALPVGAEVGKGR